MKAERSLVVAPSPIALLDSQTAIPMPEPIRAASRIPSEPNLIVASVYRQTQQVAGPKRTKPNLFTS